MIILLTYDISSNRARGRFHRFLKEFGLNTQKSVFECDLDPEGIERIVAYARRIINPGSDSVRLYRICAGCLRKVKISGRGIRIARLDYMIV
jgi:CRISPR-associated protein Cas2